MSGGSVYEDNSNEFGPTFRSAAQRNYATQKYKGYSHLWWSYTAEQRGSAPRFCPGCGNELSGALGELVRVAGPRDEWDVYCPVCDWTGNVSPDVEDA